MTGNEERIELSLETVGIDTRGIDYAIKRLEALDTLVAKSRTVTIGVDFRQLRAAHEEIRELRRMSDLPGKASGSVHSKSAVAHLRSAGLHSEANRVAEGFADANREIEHFDGLLKRLDAQRKLLSKRSFDNSGALESIDSAKRQIGLRMEELVAAEIEKLTTSEKGLTAASERATGAIKGQDESLQHKLRALHQATGETNKLAAAEKSLAAESKKAATAAKAPVASPEDLGVRTRERRRNGDLVSETFVDPNKPGVTRTRLSGRELSIVEETNHLERAKKKVSDLKFEWQEAVKLQRAAGATTADLLATHEKFAARARELAKSHSGFEAAGKTTFGRLAREMGVAGAAEVHGGTVAEASRRYQQLNRDVARLVAARRKEGATASEISTIYKKQADDVDKLAKSLEKVDPVSARGMSAAAGNIRMRSREALAGGAAFDRREQAKDLLADYRNLQTGISRTIAERKREGASLKEISRLYEEHARKLDSLATRLDPLNARGAGQIRAASGAMRSRARESLAGHYVDQEAALYKQAVRDNKAFRARIAADRARDDAENLISGLNTSGYTATQQSIVKKSGGGTRETTVFERETASMRESIRVVSERDKAGRLLNATSSETSRVFKQTADSSRYLTKNFLANTASVTAWAASVGVLYGSLNMLRHGFSEAVEMQRKQAMLTIIFDQGSAAARRLSDDTVKLASAYGRSGAEAQDAAIRFARLGLSQAQVTEAVRASLLAANVAELDVGVAADQLAAVMATFRLEAKDLATVVNQLNAVSNSYNVTNKDMLMGLGRMGALARQAGLSLQESMGMIASIVARTGRSGAEAGNAIKAITVALSNPKLREQLSEGFGIEVVKSDTGELSSLSSVLRDLYVRYQELTDAERQHLLQQVAGKQQASRLQALIDGYIDSQVNAVKSLTDLSSAEQENKAVKATLAAQLQAMITAYERLWTNLSQEGGNVGLLKVLTALITLLKNAMNAMADYSTATSIVIGVSALFAARLGVTAINLARVTRANGFLANSVRAAQGALAGLHANLVRMNRQLILSGVSTLSFTRGMIGGTGAVRAFGIAVAWATGALKAFIRAALPMALIYGAIEGINWLVEKNSDGWEKATQKLAGFNEELERLKSLGDAASIGGRLVDTVIKRLETGSATPAEVESYLKAISQVVAANDPSGSMKSGDVLSMLQQSNAAGPSVLMSQLRQWRERMGSWKGDFGLRERAVRDEAMSGLEDKLADLERRRDRTSSTSTRRDLDQKIAEARSELARLAQGAAASALDLGDDEIGVGGEDPFAALGKRMEARLKARLDAVQKVFEGFTAIDETDKLDTADAALDAQTRTIEAWAVEKEREITLRAENARAIADEAAKAASANAGFRALEKTRDAIYEIYKARTKIAHRPEWVSAGFRPGAGVSMESVRPNVERDADLAQSERDLLRLKHRASRLMRRPGVQIDQQLSEQSEEAAKAADYSRQRELELIRTTRKESLEQVDAERAKNEELRRGVSLLQAQADARKTTAMTGAAFRSGRSEGEDVLKELEGLRAVAALRDSVTGLPMNLSAAWKDVATARLKKDEVAEARALETLRGMAVRQEELLYSAAARYLQLQAEITKERRRQNEEASKAILMGDRETQIRAALGERFRRQGGALNAEQFSYLDTETRQSMASTNPDMLPMELNSVRRLDEELALLIPNVRNLNDVIEASRATFRGSETLPQTFDMRLIEDGQAKTSAIQNGIANLMKSANGWFDVVHGGILQLTQQYASQAATLRGMLLGPGTTGLQRATAGAI